MDLVKLLDVSNPRQIKDTLNIIIQHTEQQTTRANEVADEALRTAQSTFSAASLAQEAAEAASRSAEAAALSADQVEAIAQGKVDKVTGKGLSTNDYTDAEKTKLANIDLTPYALISETGNKIVLELDPMTYQIVAKLKDKNGIVINTSAAIDLPLESVVVNGSYDSTNQKIVLTLQNGNTIDVPVGALIAGLQSEITSTNKLDADLVDDTNSAHKFVLATDIATWNAKQDAISDLATIRSGAALGATALQTESDPTVPSWAKQPNKPSYNYSEINNTPTIPTVNNPTIVLRQGGVEKGRFNLNQDTGDTIDFDAGGQSNVLSDAQVDDISVVSNGVSKIYTKNGNYNASTNKLVTESDLPTQFLPLLNKTEYKGFAIWDYFGEYFPVPGVNVLQFPPIAKCKISRLGDLSVGDKILIFFRYHCTDPTVTAEYSDVRHSLMTATISGNSSDASAYTLSNVGDLVFGSISAIWESRMFAYKAEVNAKQDTISDLSTIRSGASAGATAVQPADIANMVTHDDTVTTANQSTFADNYFTKTQVIDLIYPIGSIFISVNNVNPQTYLAGTTWAAIAAGQTLWTTTTNGEGGQSVSAGLPNIKGQFGSRYATSDQQTTISGVTGNPFQIGSSNANGASGSGGGQQVLTFDASRYSSIYSDSVTTVQPPAIKVYMWKRTS